ncbi:hypothetical protein [Streptomyces sp. VRA16 Mangrove soil]|uniref:hypothetical protein n=1 Tax=Streptomyces sp. VRA16 Mangrove soil TaxID=2817434 RepID=UPI001A9CD12A|nr:hypothetical protein [Streptomyces sp. VRA16 Mangrove soil]MBO1336293.1 hypothetical protein [Streptomyces sp. VRA16 Mangrove soil]
MTDVTDETPETPETFETAETAETPELPEDHRELINDLSGIVSDYPYVEPELALTVLVDAAKDAFAPAAAPAPGSRALRERTGYAVLLYATCWYVCHRLAETGVPAAYTEAANALSAALAPAACACACADGPGSHPNDLDDPEYVVEVGVALLSEEGRAYFAEEYEPEPAEMAAYDCPAFLDHLAGEVRLAVSSG